LPALPDSRTLPRLTRSSPEAGRWSGPHPSEPARTRRRAPRPAYAPDASARAPVRSAPAPDDDRACRRTTAHARFRQRTRYRLRIVTALYTGMRISEVLALTWADVDFGAGVIHVRAQLSRAHQCVPARRVAPKTAAAIRDISRSCLSSPRSCASRSGRRRCRSHRLPVRTGRRTPLGHRNVERRAFQLAAGAAGLNTGGVPAPRFHDLPVRTAARTGRRRRRRRRRQNRGDGPSTASPSRAGGGAWSTHALDRNLTTRRRATIGAVNTSKTFR
jgi:integrase